MANSKGIEALRAWHEAGGQRGEPRDPLEKARCAPRSLRLAIDAKCFVCVGGKNADNGYHRAIRECPSKRCPLHPVRPHQEREA